MHTYFPQLYTFLIFILFPALDHSERRRPVQLALIKRRALGAAALGLVLRDDLRRDVHKVLLLVVLGEIQALAGRGRGERGQV